MLLLSFNWKSTVSRVPQGRRSEGHGTSWHRTARLRRAWTSVFSNYAHSRRRGAAALIVSLRDPALHPTSRQEFTAQSTAKEVVLFVHGYANTPQDAAFSMADLATSWASGNIR